VENEKLRNQVQQRNDLLLSGNISRVFDEYGEPLKEEDISSPAKIQPLHNSIEYLSVNYNQYFIL
jgi:hypothetical protein